VNSKNKKTLIIGLAVAMAFVILGVFCFSYAMETLDVKAEELGAQENPVYEPPLPDYTIPGMDNTSGTLILGILSTLLLFAVGFVVAKMLPKKKN
jgi:hypothetical protein